MGEVYLAEDLRLQRPVALKMLVSGAPGESQAHPRLLAEARLASALTHPAIAVVYEVDEVERDGGPCPFLAMEYVAGEPIDAWVRREKPGLDRKLALAIEIADALAHAHARGIVHRDVKPSNLFVTEAGRVKVLDFGLATRPAPVSPEESTWTAGEETPAVAGTLGYMAPEQALGHSVDARADVFSFGVVLYEMLSGMNPFAGATRWEVAGAILHRAAPPLVLAEDESLARPLAELVARLLAKDPAARPASLAEVALELERIRRAGAEGVELRLGAAVVVAGFESLTGDGADDWIAAGLAETVAADLARLDGVEVVSRDRVGEARRRLEARGALEGERLEVPLGRALGARWVVAGAVQRFGESVRVTLRLTDVARGEVAETLRLDATIDRMLQLQDRAVAELTRRLAAGGVATGGAPPHTEAEETAVVAAYEALSKGLLNLRADTFEGYARAVLFFERAVALDPRYARAHLEMAVALAQQGDYLVARELHERALRAAVTARGLRPEWARAHREVGAILIALARDEEGIAAAERAVELAPGDAAVLAGLGRALFLGRGDFAAAAHWYGRAVVANPHAGWYWLQLAHARTLDKDLDGARLAAERAIELQEKSLSGRDAGPIVGAYMRMGHALANAGRLAEAAESFQRELAFVAQVDHALRGRIVVELHYRLGAARAALGRHDEAGANLRTGLAAYERRVALGADEPFTRYYAAAIHAHLGDPERALDDLERAAAERRRYTVARARSEPDFAPLHELPRFRALVASSVS